AVVAGEAVGAGSVLTAAVEQPVEAPRLKAPGGEHAEGRGERAHQRDLQTSKPNIAAPASARTSPTDSSTFAGPTSSWARRWRSWAIASVTHSRESTVQGLVPMAVERPVNATANAASVVTAPAIHDT